MRLLREGSARIAIGLLLGGMRGSGVADAATCARIGPYDRALVSFEDANARVVISAEQFGTFAAGPARACDTPEAGADPKAHPLLSIVIDGKQMCRRSDDAARLRADPFQVFGGRVQTTRPDPSDPSRQIPDGLCGADVSWDETMGAPSAGPEDVGVGGDEAYAGRRRTALVAGSYWFVVDDAPPGSEPVIGQVPPGTTGWFNRGARITSGPR